MLSKGEGRNPESLLRILSWTIEPGIVIQREKIGKIVFHAGKKEFRVTLSAGIAVYPDNAARKQALIELADQALYQAKESGRNRTVPASSLKR